MALKTSKDKNHFFSSFRERNHLQTLALARRNLDEALGEVPIDISRVVDSTGKIILHSVALNIERSRLEQLTIRKRS